MARNNNNDPQDLSSDDYDQLIQHVFDIAHAALSSNQREEYRSTLETIADLCDPDTTLLFNGDGTVEIDEDDDDQPADNN